MDQRRAARTCFRRAASLSPRRPHDLRHYRERTPEPAHKPRLYTKTCTWATFGVQTAGKKARLEDFRGVCTQNTAYSAFGLYKPRLYIIHNQGKTPPMRWFQCTLPLCTRGYRHDSDSVYTPPWNDGKTAICRSCVQQNATICSFSRTLPQRTRGC